jgi:hypothetical protein
VASRRRFVFASPGGHHGVSGYAGGTCLVELKLFQADGRLQAGKDSRYPAAARPAIYLASSVYFKLGRRWATGARCHEQDCAS